MSAAVLVTGGAGYVGAHACLRLAEAGFRPVVFDNLSNGHEAFVRWGPFVRGDIRDRGALTAAVAEHCPVAVMHFAALIEVGESTKSPALFYEVNVGGLANVIRAAVDGGIEAFVFSSTCATYGDPLYVPLDEVHPQLPINPYGRTKLIAEQMLADVAGHTPLRFAAMRYFNAAGADPQGRIGEHHDPETHAIPLLIQAAQGLRSGFSIFGTDYETRDGTAVRDYVHVLDLADAHVLALRRLLDGGGSAAFNLGTGVGTTVRELIGAVEGASGRSIPITERDRRVGDAAVLVADSTLAERELGWLPTLDLGDIIRSAWAWHQERSAERRRQVKSK